ncbi:MAG: TolC family protein [Spirochaetota bacterium]
MKYYITIIAFTIIIVNSAFALSAKENENNDAKNISNDTQAITLNNKNLSLEEIVSIVLDNNLTLQSAKYDVIMTDTDLQTFDKRYSTTANLEGGYNYQKQPPGGMTAITGDKSYQYSASASLSKLFPTATNLTAGVREIYYDANDPGMPAFGVEKTPAQHKPSFFINLKQELLKNAFGYNERTERELKTNTAMMQRAAIVDKLTGLVLNALVDYWSLAVKKSAMENADIELKSDKEVRDIIARNSQYGLAESYDLNQYNALVAGAETKLASSSKQYRDAVRKFLRTVNMPYETQIKGVTELKDMLPDLDKEKALNAAFAKRTDYKNAIVENENAKKDLGISKNNSLPSLTFRADLSTAGQDPNYANAFADSTSSKYPNLNLTLKMSYPLDDTEQKAKLRNSYFKAKQTEYNLQNIKLEVRDDIHSNIESVELQHITLAKSRIARKESETYYQKLLVRFRQGKVNSVAMKLALDSMVQSRQQELEALVGYNIAVLQLDMAKNEIFERYNINVEKYLSPKNIKE